MERLKILIITQGEWKPRFGAIKVHIDLKEEYERQGHLVDKISWEDLYPTGQNVIGKIFGPLYTEIIFDFLKKNAHKYNVIDANFSCVVYPKKSFNFTGVLLFRSHGIGPVYRQAEQNISRYKYALESEKKRSLKTTIGNFYRSIQKKETTKEFNLSVKYADLVHCLNKAEYEYFLKEGVPKEKLLPLPNGISDGFIKEMNSNSGRNRTNSLCFVAAWNVRKGIKDLEEIVSLVDEKIRLKEIKLLGGQRPKKLIESYFNEQLKTKLSIVADFDKADLLELVGECKVGLFPSFIEGHPLAIIEQLAMGIPVVAYDVPGSRDILDMVDNSLLIEPGDIHNFSNRVIDIMQLDNKDYQALADKCKEVSRQFLLSNIAQSFTNKYKRLLTSAENIKSLK